MIQAKYKSYPAYKPSGVGWLTEIPVHWEARRLKTICRFQYGDSLSENQRKDGDIPVYGSNGIVGYHNKAICYAPCLIIGRKGSCGKVNYSDIDCFPIDTTFFIDYRNSKNNTKWLYYLLLCLRLDEDNQDSAVPGLSREKAYSHIIPFTPLPEQKAIADFLDRETARINGIVKKQTRMIELLKEKRSALITKAVTKGLDPHVKLKPSGVDWIGEIPERWEGRRLKFIKSKEKYSFVDGPFGSDLKSEHFIQNGDVFVIESNFATTGYLDENNLKTISASYFLNVKRSECKAGDIIIAKIGANFGLCEILPPLSKPSLVSGNSMKLALNNLLTDVKYFYYYWLTLKRNGVIDLLSKSTAQPALNLYQLANINILIPPLPEQRAIANFLDRETAKIDTLIEKIERQIELLNEYKQSLITSAVTGKIDVPTALNISVRGEANAQNS